jgi:hypothetical protein
VRQLVGRNAGAVVADVDDDLTAGFGTGQVLACFDLPTRDGLDGKRGTFVAGRDGGT